ncbi:MAG: hypothetical protein HY282_00155 [Nitrospirae bacterium]|nr:hypothetical protein [Candidatus Manganitrophaceae bacterium]
MFRRGIAVVLLLGLLLSAGLAESADEKDALNRSRILREHHHLMHQMLMVMKDQAQLTEKLLAAKPSASEKKAIRKKLADIYGEIDGMIQKHEALMKSFEEMIQKREIPEKPAEGAP